MKKSAIFLFLFFMIFFSGCIDLPNEFKAPVIPYEGISIPIVDKSYTLWDAIKKDTTNISKNSNNLLIFKQTKNLSTVVIGDKLSAEPFTQVTTKQKEQFKVKLSKSQANIGYDWTGTYGPNQNVTSFPSVEGIQEVQIDPINEIQNAVIQSGSIKLTITNSFPTNSGVTLTISNITIKNADNSNDIAVYNQDIIIPPDNFTQINIPLIQNATIKKNIKALITIKSTSSSNSFITPAQTGFFAIEESIIYIKQGNVIIPGQDPIIQNDSLKIDTNDSLRIYTATIKNGQIQIQVNNQLDLIAKTKITFKDMYKSPLSSLPFDTIVTIPRKSNSTIIININNKQIRSDSPDKYVKFLHYDVITELDSSLNSNDYRTVSVDDKVNITTTTNKILLKQAVAKVKPTYLNPIQETNKFTTGDANFSNFKFNKIMFNDNTKLKIKFNMGTNIPIKVVGSITSQQATLPITLNHYVDKNNSEISLNLSDFLNSMGNSMIENLNYNISPIFNPNYVVVDVVDTNTITPSYNIEIPLKISIDKGSYVDTTDKIDPPSQDDRKKANDVKKARIVLDIDNGIPASVYAKIKILDKNGKVLFDVPIKDSTLKSDSIYISPAYVDNNGKVTQSYKKIVIQEISTKYIDKVFDMEKAVIEISLSTRDSSNSKLVEFTTDQRIKIKAYAKLDFVLNPDNF